MSGVWVAPDDGGVLHYLPVYPNEQPYGVYRRGRAHIAIGRCLCSRVRDGEQVTLQPRGTAATRCREIADRRGIARPLPPIDWHAEALALARSVQTGLPPDRLDIDRALALLAEPNFDD